jgi:hypothetical protein
MDGMTLLLMLLVMINYKSKWGIIFAILLGTQHFEQGFASFLLLIGSMVIFNIFSKCNIDWKNIKNSIYIIFGIILGKVILYVWFNIADIELLGNRLTYLEKHLNRSVNQWFEGWLYILFSLFGVGWITVLKQIRITYPLIIASVVTFFFVMTVADQTRVGSIILFPSLFYWIFMNVQVLNKITIKDTIISLSLYLLIPIVYVWNGHPFGSLIKYDLQVISESKHDHYNINFITPFKQDKKLKFNSIIIEGRNLNSQVGKIDKKFRTVKFGIDKVGYITFGPYIQLVTGKYNFNIAYISSESNTTVVGNWDAVLALPKQVKILKKGNLIGTNNKESHIIQSFTIPKEYSNEKIEIRNFYNGLGDLTIKSLTITREQ